MEKSIVLLSGGLDSTVNLFEAVRTTEVILSLTFDYGQKAAEKEILHSRLISESLKIPSKVIKLPFFNEFTKTSLINKDAEIPTNIQLDSSKETLKSAQSVWVPNRNGIFLNIAAGFAEGLGAQLVIPGFNLEEAQTFPDNTKDFLSVLDRSFSFSTSTKIRAKCFTIDMNKKQIAARGNELGVDFKLIWSCYFGNNVPCKVCESCLRFYRATEGIL